MKVSRLATAVGLSIHATNFKIVAAGILPITGIHTGQDPKTGAYPPRLRIQDLQKSGPAWDLYIQGLTAFQQVPEEDEFSYLQLSGIHGRPYVSWNGVEQVEGGPSTGYCTHNEILFAIWHRPLVVAFEQVLATHVQKAASKYTGELSNAYRAAADSWRHPYWDWAEDTGLPDIVIQPNVTINGPYGPITMANPLVTYTFHHFPLNETLFPPNCEDDENLDRYRQTLRCPDPTTNLSQPLLSDDNIHYVDLASQVYNIYTRVSNFESMSSTARDSTSFENQHNEVHVSIGGLHPMGHFAHLGYSGFDPIFMMHHASIDRHVALWQAIHYNATMFKSNYTSATGQFGTAPGTLITADSPLKPFYADITGKFHSANSASNISTFGYTYPELKEAVSSSREELSLKITAQVNRLYGPSAPKPKRKRQSSFECSGRETSKQYFVQFSIEKSEVDLPAMLNIWLGKEHAGRLILMTSPKRGVMHGEVALQEPLEKLQDERGCMSTDRIRSYITHEFRWDITKFDGERLDITSISSFLASIQEEEVIYPSDETRFPAYSNAKVIWNSTRAAVSS